MLRSGTAELWVWVYPSLIVRAAIYGYAQLCHLGPDSSSKWLRQFTFPHPRQQGRRDPGCHILINTWSCQMFKIWPSDEREIRSSNYGFDCIPLITGEDETSFSEVYWPLRILLL